ncbi:MAG: tRNA (N6-threonylcarbamoyladenosine(37)-N6)-methyltransferase TrmO [Candidatus Lokiarchaeota archaeon]|nr:tRNA (N6-threonylcarbamoyladenosine(37)-N6)-methyltransferase TrmO [Candidatus Lokiarchaeota archaeon]
MEKWTERIEQSVSKEISQKLRKTNKFLEKINHQFEKIKNEIQKEENKTADTIQNKPKESSRKLREDKAKTEEGSREITFRKIGTIHTPYQETAPYQPVENDKGKFSIVLDTTYKNGLKELAKFDYIYVIYHIHAISRKTEPIITPPWTNGHKVGIFASRSPLRPNPIGLSVVKVKEINDNIIFTSGLDVFNNTPLLDIKPYIKDLDSKQDANYGWIKDLEGYEHLLLHLKGIPHDY